MHDVPTFFTAHPPARSLRLAARTQEWCFFSSSATHLYLCPRVWGQTTWNKSGITAAVVTGLMVAVVIVILERISLEVSGYDTDRCGFCAQVPWFLAVLAVEGLGGWKKSAE